MSARDALAAARNAFQLIVELSTDPTAKRIAERTLATLDELVDRPSAGAIRTRRWRGKDDPPTVTVTDGDVSVTHGDARGEGGVLSSDLQRDQDPEGERERGDALCVTVTLAPERYRAAYEAGLREAGGKPWAMPRKQEGDLHQAILAFGGGKRGDDLLAWIQSSARDFGTFVRKLPPGDRVYWSHGAPAGFLRWHNAEAPREPVAPAPRGVGPAPVDPPRLRPEERRERDRWAEDARNNPVDVKTAAAAAIAAIGKGART